MANLFRNTHATRKRIEIARAPPSVGPMTAHPKINRVAAIATVFEPRTDRWEERDGNG
jgi:hypothetical protein